MERYDVSEGARLAEMVEVASHGEEVVITRGGEQVARLTATSAVPKTQARVRSGAEMVAELDEFHRALPTELRDLNWTGTVDRMRDEDWR